MKMKMVKQLDPRTGCGVAVFAMLTKRDFDDALAYLLTRRGEWISRTSHHMTVNQMRAALEAELPERTINVRHRPLLDPWCAVYVVYRKRWRHWLAWDGERFFDPLSPGGPTKTIRRKITRVVTTWAQSKP